MSLDSKNGVRREYPFGVKKQTTPPSRASRVAVWARLVALLVGIAAIIGGNVHWVVFRPELTVPQAARGLWYWWLTAIVLIVASSPALSNR